VRRYFAASGDWRSGLSTRGRSECAKQKRSQFVEVAVKPVKSGWRSSAGADMTIEIRLRSGLSLFVGPGFEASHLRALLSELEG